MRRIVVAAWICMLLAGPAGSQTQQVRPAFDAFDVATVKPIEHNPRGGRYFKMVGPHRFIAKDYNLKLLIALAYDMNSKTISGGPEWLDSQYFDIEAIVPGDVQPTRLEQMKMLRALLAERFKLVFHRQEKQFSIYELTVTKGGPKLRASATPDGQPNVISVVSEQKVELPARNASMDDFVAMLQRALLDRPVLDKTGLPGKYDFDLVWAPDETQFGGELPKAADDAPSPPLFTAIQEQLGLKLTATHGMVNAMVVDNAEKPTAG